MVHHRDGQPPGGDQGIRALAAGLLAELQEPKRALQPLRLRVPVPQLPRGSHQGQLGTGPVDRGQAQRGAKIIDVLAQLLKPLRRGGYRPGAAGQLRAGKPPSRWRCRTPAVQLQSRNLRSGPHMIPRPGCRNSSRPAQGGHVPAEAACESLHKPLPQHRPAPARHYCGRLPAHCQAHVLSAARTLRVLHRSFHYVCRRRHGQQFRSIKRLGELDSGHGWWLASSRRPPVDLCGVRCDAGLATARAVGDAL